MKRLLPFILLTLTFTTFSFAQISSDTCSDANSATAITGPGTFTVTTIDGSEIPDPICANNGSGATNGEWYRYIPSADYYVTVSTDLPQNSGQDTRVHVYTGTCGSLTCHGGDDDSGAGYLTVASFNVTAGQTYYIAWDDKWENAGFDFELTESTSTPPPPPLSFTTVPVATSGTDRALVDMNGDFLDDVLAVSTTNVHIQYQQNDGSFVTANYPISASYTPSWSLAAGDFDGNGYNDMVFGSSSGVNVVKANSTGTGYSVAATNDDVFTQRTNFVDINNDGDLDIFVCHDVEPNVYYINDGSGGLNFYQGANASGVPEGLGLYPSGGNYGSVWIDYDNDGDIDMFLAKCGGNEARRTNQLFRNNGSGSYTEVGVAAGLDDPMQTWSSAWGDYDGDGDMDCWVGASSGSHKMMQNNGDGTFTDITASTGLSTFTATGIENTPHDFDNDGYIDILSNGNILFNNGDGTFTVNSSGMPPSGAVGDLNDDGFLDVFNGSLYYNDTNSNNWLKIITIGTQSNLNGIGARIEVNSPGLGTQIRDVRSAEGFRYMSSLNTHFGLGTDNSITSVTVYWPSGVVDVIANPAVNGTLTITEGETLSLQQSIVDDLILYPNPTKDVLNLNATYGFDNAIYSVFDMNGRRVMNSRFNTNTIDVSELSTGNYILRIMDEGVIKSQKFIKQ